MEEPVKRKRVRRYGEVQKAEYIKQWKEIGGSKKGFCKENNLNYYTFTGWLNPKKKRGMGAASRSSFVAVKVRESEVCPFAEVKTGRGVVIRLYREVGAEYLRNIAFP
jgi:hypothetical protein